VEALKNIILLVLLGWASYMDVRRREVNDRVWLLALLLCLPFTLHRLCSERFLVVHYLTSVILSTLWVLLVAHVTSMGGADVKAYLTISVLEVPAVPGPLPPALKVFVYSALLSVTYVPLKMLIVRLRGGGRPAGIEWGRETIPLIPYITAGYILYVLGLSVV